MAQGRREEGVGAKGLVEGAHVEAGSESDRDDALRGGAPLLTTRLAAAQRDGEDRPADGAHLPHRHEQAAAPEGHQTPVRGPVEPVDNLRPARETRPGQREVVGRRRTIEKPRGREISAGRYRFSHQ